jgi:hypothetical protein
MRELEQYEGKNVVIEVQGKITGFTPSGGVKFMCGKPGVNFFVLLPGEIDSLKLVDCPQDYDIWEPYQDAQGDYYFLSGDGMWYAPANPVIIPFDSPERPLKRVRGEQK